MAEFTKTPYADIVWMSLVPAILYFLSVLLYVHILAVKAGFTGLQDGPKALDILKDGLHFLLPLILITALLLQNYSPVLVGVSGCAAVVCASLMRRHTRIGIAQLVTALRQGAVLAIPISVACAIAGVVVGTIGQTGVGLQFTESVVALSNGQLWLALLLVALAALILGMGLPATAAYIVLAVMTGPALQELGLALITAHMIIFWLSQTSNVTPPIALAAFASAGIAGASPMRSAVEAFKLSSGLFVIPLMMAYSPLLLGGQLLAGEFSGMQIGWLQVAYAGCTTLALILVVAMLVERFLFTRVNLLTTVVCLVSVALLLIPGYLTQSIGIALSCVALIGNYTQHRFAKRTKSTS